MKSPITIHRSFLLRILLAAMAFLWVFYAWNGILPHQLSGAPLFDIRIDNTFWLFHFIGLADVLHRFPFLIIILEVTTVVLALVNFVRVRTIWVTALLLCVVALSLYQQTYSCTMTKIGVVPALVLLPFCFKEEHYPTLLKFIRYYLVYIMASAAIFKVLHGGLWHGGQMEQILVYQHADLRLANPGSWHLHIARLLSEYALAGPAYILVFLMELSFIGLLFTGRFDRLYAIVLLLFCLGIFAVMRINTLELCLLSIPLWMGSPKNH